MTPFDLLMFRALTFTCHFCVPQSSGKHCPCSLYWKHLEALFLGLCLRTAVETARPAYLTKLILIIVALTESSVPPFKIIMQATRMSVPGVQSLVLVWLFGFSLSVCLMLLWDWLEHLQSCELLSAFYYPDSEDLLDFQKELESFMSASGVEKQVISLGKTSQKNWKVTVK